MRSTTGKTYEVVVWATGGVGRYAIRTAADRPNLEFVGAWVHSAANI
jgi:2,4-diaminopentanoate dehydrogenase